MMFTLPVVELCGVDCIKKNHFSAVPRLIACDTGISFCVMGSTIALMVQVLVSWINFGPVGTSEDLTTVDSANIKPGVIKNELTSIHNATSMLYPSYYKTNCR